MASTARPTMIQISTIFDISNISPSSINPSPLVRELLDRAQIVQDPLRVVVPQEDLTLRGFDANAASAPNICPMIANASNAKAAKYGPGSAGKGLNLICGNGSQTKSQCADLKPTLREDIVKSVPSGECRAPDNKGRYKQSDSQSSIRDQVEHKCRRDSRRKQQQRNCG